MPPQSSKHACVSIDRTNRIQREMKKLDNQILTPQKTVINTLRNPAMPTKAPSKKKYCKKSLRISWRRY
jgi:hypothetical protein